MTAVSRPSRPPFTDIAAHPTATERPRPHFKTSKTNDVPQLGVLPAHTHAVGVGFRSIYHVEWLCICVLSRLTSIYIYSKQSAGRGMCELKYLHEISPIESVDSDFEMSKVRSQIHRSSTFETLTFELLIYVYRLFYVTEHAYVCKCLL